MAIFAQLDDNNIVINTIVVNDDDCGGGTLENESVGVSYCKNLLGDDTNWKLSSKNAMFRGNNPHFSFRGNPAGIGMTYMSGVRTLGVTSTDIFIEQQPYPSWSIGVNTATWYSPLGDDISGPGITSTAELDNDGKSYVWDESLYQSDNTKGWDLK